MAAAAVLSKIPAVAAVKEYSAVQHPYVDSILPGTHEPIHVFTGTKRFIKKSHFIENWAAEDSGVETKAQARITERLHCTSS
jgi:hypothetical protein